MAPATRLRPPPKLRTSHFLPPGGAIQTQRFLSGRRGDPETEVLSWKGWRGPAYPNHWRRSRQWLQPPRLRFQSPISWRRNEPES